MGWQRWWFAVPMVVVLSAGVSLMRVTMQEQVVALACSEARRTEPDLHCDAESVINEVRSPNEPHPRPTPHSLPRSARRPIPRVANHRVQLTHGRDVPNHA